MIDARLCETPQGGIVVKLLFNVGSLIDGTGSPLRKNMSVLVEGGRITRIGAQGTIDAEGATVIDAPDQTLIPGLIDTHFHLFLLLLKPVGGASEVTHMTDEMIATRVFKAANAAKVWLQMGVTTVRDAGAGEFLAGAMQEAIRDGYTPGPRVIASGPLIAQTGGFRPGSGSHGVEVTGVDEARREARLHLKAGVDVVKIYGASTIGGGGGRLISEPGWTQFTVEEMRAIVEEAHKPGRLTSCHTGSAQSIKNAIMAGVDFIDHATYMDQECIDMLLATNTPIVPTQAIAWSLEHFGEKMGFGPHIARKSAEVSAVSMECLAKAYKAGVRIAAGTDADNPHASLAKECELLVEIGMSNMEALVAATKTAAEILRLDATLGTVETGKIADVVLLDRNPLDDIRNLTTVARVFQSGKEVSIPSTI
ncbi:MAG: amidohydrolase family protein [Chloroflexi bacterium]|nr:amidohydrolase family protein [Chloroflexota bacterium]